MKSESRTFRQWHIQMHVSESRVRGNCVPRDCGVNAEHWSVGVNQVLRMIFDALFDLQLLALPGLIQRSDVVIDTCYVIVIGLDGTA